MTLSRKIVLRNVCLLAGLVLLGAVSLWGMLGMWRNVRTSVEEYGELRQFEFISRRILGAKDSLRPETIDTGAAVRQLRDAIGSIEEFQRAHETYGPEPLHHEVSERSAMAASRERLQRVVQYLETTNPPRAMDYQPDLDDVDRRMSQLVLEADELVATIHSDALVDLRRAIAAVALAFAGIVVAALVISILQHRGIMRPLEAVRHAIRRISSGRFDQRIRPSGDREFTELAADVNRMAGELDDLYRNLEHKVETKSRELVQSERLASVGFLAAGVAHEINNPLGIMSGFAELSLKRLRDEPSNAAAIDDATRSLEIIRDEAFRCRQITERLLSLARPSQDRDDQPVSIATAIDELLGLVRGHKEYGDRQVIIAREEAPGSRDLIARGNEAAFKQVLLNLIVNALDATSPEVGQVRIAAARRAQHIEVEIADNGCGMNDEVRRRLFEPFFSARRRGARGVGLGLSITRAIVEGFGGSIRAHSDGVGRGSKFTVLLPAHADVPADNTDTRTEPVEVART